jgi:hypothetical protein
MERNSVFFEIGRSFIVVPFIEHRSR